jgi:hypothetical protein
MAAAGSTVLVTAFNSTQQAEQAMADLRRQHLGDPQLVGAAAAPADGEMVQVLVAQGVPEGQARWYAAESEAGKAIVLLLANGQADAARAVLLRHGGYDVGSRGGALSGGSAPVAEQAEAAPPPIDVTHHWEDVWTRYEMLFDQRYGAGDVTWDQYEPAYRWAWQMATSPAYSGRAWDEVQPTVQRAWAESHPSLRWDDVAEGMGDVWDDVAEEAGTLAEGGASASTEKPFV